MAGDSNEDHITIREREQRMAYWMLGPTFVVVFLIIIFPVIWNFWLSFKPVTLGDLGEGALFGLDFTLENFEEVLFNPRLAKDLVVALIYATVGVSISIFLGVTSALLLNLKFKGRGILRGLYLFPYISPIVAVTYVAWSWMLNPTFGVIPWVLRRLGIISNSIGFLSEEPFALISVLLFQGWRNFPFVLLFVLAELQSIPEALYESANVDGATPFQKFRYVTFPHIRGILATVFLLRFMWAFNKFDDIYLLTKGSGGTEILPVLVYRYLIGRGNVGYGAATSVIIFVILGFLLFLYFRYVLREW